MSDQSSPEPKERKISKRQGALLVGVGALVLLAVCASAYFAMHDSRSYPKDEGIIDGAHFRPGNMESDGNNSKSVTAVRFFAVHDIKKGQKIVAKDLEVHENEVSDFDAVDPARFVGRIAHHDIRAGEVLQEVDLVP